MQPAHVSKELFHMLLGLAVRDILSISSEGKHR
jgi:hypothetical protein